MSFRRTLMVERPWALWDSINSMPSAPAMTRSKGTVMKPRTNSALALGIPGSLGAAILLGALEIKGLKPGPDMLKADLNITETEAVESYAEKKGLTLVGRVPFDPVFTKAMVQGQTIFEYDRLNPGATAYRNLAKELIKRFELKAS